MKKTGCFLAMFLLVMPFVWGIQINEVMYNPPSIDNNNEFIEIFGTNNLSGYTIGDLASNDSLELVKFISGNYSLIVEEGFNYTDISANCSVYSVGPTIGNNLNNGDDTIFLYYNNTLVDFMGYDGSLANGNGHSLELINGTWYESCKIGGSPCQKNCFVTNESINQTTNATLNETTNQTTNESTNQTEENTSSAGLKLEIIITDRLFMGLVYTSLFKITNLNHTQGVEDFIFVKIKYNVTKNNSLVKEGYFNKTINYYSSSNTGRLFFEETGNYTLCGSVLNPNESITICRNFTVINPLTIPCFIELNLTTDKEMYINREKVKIKNIINNKSFPFIIEYWVEDLFGNDVKKRYNTSNTNQKTYTPRITEKDRVFLVKNKLVFVACNNFNTDLENEKMIIIKKEEASLGQDDDSDSSLSIDFVYLSRSGILNFGNSFKVKLSIHKGDTSKSVIKVFAEKNDKKISEETKFYLNKKNWDYNITVPVLLQPNCNKKLRDGRYNLVVEGLGKKISEEIEVEGNKKGVCKQEEIKETGKIISFYTQSKKYRARINLYANVKTDKAYDLALIYKKGEQEKKINDSGKIKFIAEPEPGINLFILELRKDGKVIDTKTLLVELEAEEKKESLIEQVLLGSEDKTKETIKELNATINSSPTQITGRVVYESDNTKILKYTPYILIFVLILTIVGLIVSKRR